MSLFSLYRQWFPRFRPIYKIAIFGHETWPLAKVPEVAQILSFYPRGSNSKLSFFRSMGSSFRDTDQFFQNCHIQFMILGHETWPLVKVPQVAHVLSFYPKGSKLSLFSLYGQRFLRYGPIFKIAIFGHETCPLAKVPEVANIISPYPTGSKLSLFSLYKERLLRCWKNCHIWA